MCSGSWSAVSEMIWVDEDEINKHRQHGRKGWQPCSCFPVVLIWRNQIFSMWKGPWAKKPEMCMPVGVLSQGTTSFNKLRWIHVVYGWQNVDKSHGYSLSYMNMELKWEILFRGVEHSRIQNATVLSWHQCRVEKRSAGRDFVEPV